MTTKAKIIGAVAGLAALASVGTGVITAYAAQDANGPHNFMANIASAIAQKFNLNPSDVQDVIDDQLEQDRAQIEQEQEQAFENRLSDAVSAGKLTQAQADLVLAEKAKVGAQIEALKGKTGEELRTAMRDIMNAERQWAKDNNIPQGYMMFGFGGPMMRKGGEFGNGMMKHFQNNWDDDSDSRPNAPTTEDSD